MNNRFGAGESAANLRRDGLNVAPDLAAPHHMRVGTIEESYR